MDFKFTDNDLDASFDENSATKIDVSNTKEITKCYLSLFFKVITCTADMGCFM